LPVVTARRTFPLRRLLLVLGAAVALTGCGGDDAGGPPPPQAREAIALTSPAFADGADLPRRFTCDGGGVSPPLRWSGVPDGARELALLVTDPDADGFRHWTLLGLPADAREIGEGQVPAGAIQAENGFGRRGWGAACPPEGDDAHRYVFTLYALDAPSGLGADASPDAVRDRLAATALARGVLTARYARG
jgi:Raf kinase inhibitor-like YbhB/YbcL family protein